MLLDVQNLSVGIGDASPLEGVGFSVYQMKGGAFVDFK